MRNTLMLTFALLICAACSQAQAASPSSDAAQPPAKGMTVIQGCLSEPVGEYTLTDSEGLAHKLAGGANKLKHYVGHQIEVTGKPGIRTIDTTMAGAASSAIEERVFEVKSVKEIAASCKSAGR